MEKEKKKSNVLLWVLGGCGVLALLAVLAVGGLAWFGISQAKTMAIDELNGYAAVQEHVGEITDIDLDFEAMEQSQGTVMIQVTGSKSSATIEAVPDQTGSGKIIGGGSIVMPDGTRHELVP